MLASEVIKLQAKLLEWEASKAHAISSTKARLTPTRWKDKELGVCVGAETATEGVWVRDKYLKLFGKGDYDLYIAPEAKQLWLTVPDTREVLGVIARVRGINKKLEALKCKKGDKKWMK